MEKPSTLQTLDGRLLDGLNFCKIAYRAFDAIKKSKGGIEKLRLMPGHSQEKKLLEEILPIASYVKRKYTAGRTLRVRWTNGSQNFDACIFTYGEEVHLDLIPKQQYLEVTTVVHKNDHLAREFFHQHGHSFGAVGTKRNPTTGQIESKPVVRDWTSLIYEFANRIHERIEAKSRKTYPQATTLVVNCKLDTVYLHDEWNSVINFLRQKQIKHIFREVAILDSSERYFDSL